MTTLRLTQHGFATVPTTGIIVFLTAGKPLCGNINTWPKSMGGGTYMNWYRGNSAGAQPFVFSSIEKAVEAIGQIENASKEARFFIGNNWIGEMKSGIVTMFETPIKQLL